MGVTERRASLGMFEVEDMKKTIVQAGKEAFKNKRVLVRVDFNVPQHEDGSVADDSRIRAALPTINFLREAGASIILMSHLGRPKGDSPKLTLKPVADKLSELLSKDNVKVHFASDCVGPLAEKAVQLVKPGEICVLENLRFHPEEEKNDKKFAEQLAKLGQIYVDDAFGTAHRAHASTEGVTHFLRPALAGMLVDLELKVLSQTLDNPARPFATIIGGAKVSSKIGVLENLMKRVDVLVIGGAMAFTFLKARGIKTGKSLVEDDRLDYCRELDKKAKEKGINLILPVDVVCALEMKAGAKTTIVELNEKSFIPDDLMGLDVGPKTTELVSAALAKCKTILWNGPMGVFEIKEFEKGTYQVIDDLVKVTRSGSKTIVGGGDSVAAIKQKGTPEDALTHLCTGGGASLEFIEGLELPGIACLDEAEPAHSRS